MILDKNKYIKFFANCLLVKGAKRGVVCDTGRVDLDLIPNDLIDLLENNNDKTISEIENIAGEENKETLNEYFTFFLENEYIFLCDKYELELFPKLDLRWDYPAKITNSIIDDDGNSNHDYQKLFLQLEKLGCTYVQLRMFYKIELNKIYSIFNLLEESNIENISVVLEFNDNYVVSEYVDFANCFVRINELIIYNFNKEIIDTPHTHKIIFEKNTINQNSCGLIDSSFFAINIPHYTESQKHNTCLNRKIGIDVNGEIKNCPSMTKSYGNIKNTTLEYAIKNDEFKAMWFINKDQIEVCKDCEFRHICTDCRAFIQDGENINSKPLKCGYNPYTNVWEEWSTNPIKNNH